MRVKIVADSATPTEVYNLTLAFQRTRRFGLPNQITNKPTVEVVGTQMTWISPNLGPARAEAIFVEVENITRGPNPIGQVSVEDCVDELNKGGQSA